MIIFFPFSLTSLYPGIAPLPFPAPPPFAGGVGQFVFVVYRVIPSTILSVSHVILQLYNINVGGGPVAVAPPPPPLPPFNMVGKLLDHFMTQSPVLPIGHANSLAFEQRAVSRFFDLVSGSIGTCTRQSCHCFSDFSRFLVLGACFPPQMLPGMNFTKRLPVQGPGVPLRWARQAMTLALSCIATTHAGVTTVATTILYDSLLANQLQTQDTLLRCQHTPDTRFLGPGGSGGLNPAVGIVPVTNTLEDVVDLYTARVDPAGVQVGGLPPREGCAVIVTDYECTEQLLLYLTHTIQNRYQVCLANMNAGGGFYNAGNMIATFPSLANQLGPFAPTLSDDDAHEWIRERFIVTRTDCLLAVVSPCSTGQVSPVARLAFIAASGHLNILNNILPGICPGNIQLPSVPHVRVSNYILRNGGPADRRINYLNQLDTQLDFIRRQFMTYQVVSCTPSLLGVNPRQLLNQHAPLAAGLAGPLLLRILDKPSDAVPTHDVIQTQITEHSSRFLATFRANVATQILSILSMALQGINLRADSLNAVPNAMTTENTIAGNELLGGYQSDSMSSDDSKLDSHTQCAFSHISNTLTMWGNLLIETLHLTVDDEKGHVPDLDMGKLLETLVIIARRIGILCARIPQGNQMNTADDAYIFQQACGVAVALAPLPQPLQNALPRIPVLAMQNPAMGTVQFLNAFSNTLVALLKVSRNRRVAADLAAGIPVQVYFTSEFLPDPLPSLTNELDDTLRISILECLKRRHEAILIPHLQHVCNVAARVTNALVATFVPGPESHAARIACDASGHHLTDSPPRHFNESNALNDMIGKGTVLRGLIRNGSNVTTSPRQTAPAYSTLSDVILADGQHCRVCFSVNTIAGDVVAGSDFVVAPNHANVLHVILTTSLIGQRQYEEELAAMHPDQRPPPARIHCSHITQLQLYAPAVAGGGGPLQQSEWYRLHDIVAGDFGPLCAGVALVQLVRDTSVYYDTLENEPIGINFRLIGFHVQAPVAGNPVGVYAHQLTRFVDEIRIFDLWTSDTLTYGLKYSDLLHDAIRRITTRRNMPRRPDADNIRQFPGALAAVIGAPAVLPASATHFINEILFGVDETDSWTPLRIYFMRDMATVRPNDDDRRDSAEYIAGDTALDVQNAHCSPIQYMMGLNGGAGPQGHLPLWPPHVLFNAPPLQLNAILPLLKERILYCATFGGMQNAPAAVVPQPHLAHIIHADIDMRINSLGQFLGLFNAINNPNPPQGGPLSRIRSTLLPYPLVLPGPGGVHVEDVAIVSAGPACAAHDTLPGNDAVQYSVLDSLVLMCLLSFAASTDTDSIPLCVYLPPDTGSGMPSLESVRQSLHARLVCLLSPQQVHHLGRPPHAHFPPPFVTRAQVVNFVDMILTHFSLVDSPHGRFEFNPQQERCQRTHQLNTILIIGGVVSTITGENSIIKTQFAHQANARALQGFPTIEERRCKSGELQFRTFYMSVRGTLESLRLSGYKHLGVHVLMRIQTDHLIILFPDVGMSEAAARAFRDTDHGFVHAGNHGARPPCWSLVDRYTGLPPVAGVVSKEFVVYTGVDTRDRYIGRLGRPNLGTVSHVSSVAMNEMLLDAIKELALYDTPAS